MPNQLAIVTITPLGYKSLHVNGRQIIHTSPYTGGADTLHGIAEDLAISLGVTITDVKTSVDSDKWDWAEITEKLIADGKLADLANTEVSPEDCLDPSKLPGCPHCNEKPIFSVDSYEHTWIGGWSKNIMLSCCADMVEQFGRFEKGDVTEEQAKTTLFNKWRLRAK